MEFLTFIADWILNIIGGLFVVAGFVIGIAFLFAWLFGSLSKDPPPTQGIVTDTVKAGADGCFSIGLIWFIVTIIAAFGAWLIDVL